MRPIDADALVKDMETVCSPTQFGRSTAKMCIKRAPTIPAEVVVHCRECRYWSGDRDTGGTWGDCEKIGDRDNEGGASFDCSTCCSDYCSEGERREDGKT